MNLGTTFVGILLTIGYVDIVLNEHDRLAQVRVVRGVGKRLENVAIIASSQFRIAFGFEPDVYDSVVMAGDDVARRTEVARVATHAIRPAARERIAALNAADWPHLMRQLAITWTSMDRLIGLFGRRLEPDTIAILVEMQDSHRAIQDRYAAFPDVLGVDDRNLKPNKRGESSVPFKRALERQTADDVVAILDRSVELLENITRMTLQAAPVRKAADS